MRPLNAEDAEGAERCCMLHLRVGSIDLLLVIEGDATRCRKLGYTRLERSFVCQ
jgi:hypothetical protein